MLSRVGGNHYARFGNGREAGDCLFLPGSAHRAAQVAPARQVQLDIQQAKGPVMLYALGKLARQVRIAAEALEQAHGSRFTQHAFINFKVALDFFFGRQAGLDGGPRRAAQPGTPV